MPKVVTLQRRGRAQIYIRAPCAPWRSPSGKMLTHAQVLAYVYIIVNFQLRCSINAGLTERSLYNRPIGFALKLERSPKMGILGVGAKIFCGNPPPRNALTADIRRLVKKMWRFSKYPIVCTSGKEITKKNIKTECLRREGYISPLCSVSPLNP